jgi:hypothetical protein
MLEGKHNTRRQFVKAIDRAIVVAPGPKNNKVNSLHESMQCAVYSYRSAWMVGCIFLVFVSCSSASTSAGKHIEMTLWVPTIIIMCCPPEWECA